MSASFGDSHDLESPCVDTMSSKQNSCNLTCSNRSLAAIILQLVTTECRNLHIQVILALQGDSRCKVYGMPKSSQSNLVYNIVAAGVQMEQI